MVRSALGKVAWVGRTASMVFGLALVMALVLGVATMAFGANGQNFILGKLNNAATSVTGLVGNVDGGPALRVTNPNAGTNDTALDLRVQAGEAPMKVNSTTRVANLNAASAGRADSAATADSATSAQNATNAQNADELDGQDSTTLLPGGDLPKDRTLRGHYNIYDKASPQQSGQENMPISFGYRLASAPTVRIIKANTSPPAECPGTASAPEAASGYLCIYETSSYNLYSSSYRTYPYVYGTSRIGTHIAADSAVNTSTTYDSTFYTYGTWAVTGN